ncbi:MAG: zinc ribbon domain-containing protein [Bacteroidales bacterium]|nr:zinc ribbon domain-containing protein [Bacteroidales bacterium]
MKNLKTCQSCGLPVESATSKHTQTIYCNHCYENGKFKSPNLTANEMKKMVKERMQKMGVAKAFVDNFTDGIDKLERWNKNKTNVF